MKQSRRLFVIGLPRLTVILRFMEKDLGQLRSYGAAPFRPGDIDVDALRATLQEGRRIDRSLKALLKKSGSGRRPITEDEAIRAFNALIESDFYLDIDVDFARLRPEIRRLLELALEAGKKGEVLDHHLLRTLNRALIHAVYPAETVRSRQYERFAVPELMKTMVTLSPLSSTISGTYDGKLLNISLGGMALLLPTQLPEATYWALKITFDDRSELETLVQIRHSIAQRGQFLHGFQFVSIPSFLAERLETIGIDFAACEERIRRNAREICHVNCALFEHCAKPQRLKAAA